MGAVAGVSAEDIALSLQLITFFTELTVLVFLGPVALRTGEGDLLLAIAFKAAVVPFLLAPLLATGVGARLVVAAAVNASLTTFIVFFFFALAFCWTTVFALTTFARDLGLTPLFAVAAPFCGRPLGAIDEEVSGPAEPPLAAADLAADVELLPTLSMAEDDCPFLFVRISDGNLCESRREPERGYFARFGKERIRHVSLEARTCMHIEGRARETPVQSCSGTRRNQRERERESLVQGVSLWYLLLRGAFVWSV